MIKSPIKLIISIILAQSAGFIGSLFTFSAIPTWYATLVKPSFSPPNWLFGPVWTLLYTLIGISFYKIWINKQKRNKYWPKAINFFLIHLVLNSIWSIIFFGAKNLGLAFFEIIILFLTIIYMIKRFAKIDKIASYLLIPYLLWVSFASILNFSIWQLNKSEQGLNIFAEEILSEKSFNDFLFSQDKYRESFTNFESKRNSYNQNPTLLLKEELRQSLFVFLSDRNDYKRAYLTLIRAKVSESRGLTTGEKETIYSKIDPQVVWIENRKNVLNSKDSLEDLINKSNEEDSKYKNEVMPIIYYSISYESTGSLISIKDDHIKMYQNLKKESEELVKLGRADMSLFTRWYQDIDNEIKNIENGENNSKKIIEQIFSEDNFSLSSTFNKGIEEMISIKSSLFKLNGYIKELEQVISEKR